MTAEKCCLCFKLEAGCILLGIITFVVSVIGIITTVVVILPVHAEDFKSLTSNITKSHHHILELVSDTSVKTVFVGFAMIVCLLWIVVSVMLIVGIVKKRVNFVMTYFLFGIAMSIMHLLSALLEVISGFWVTSLVTSILTLAYIKCLTSVYAAYDKMRQQKTVDDWEQLLNEDDSMIEC
ncbi:uncharacterized protein LOC125235169 [Leguminivora glycinivorella]|uniref:uncharacterized protein LOC125235169 n=1 Tax=Leguminivora glycinivorella TaxID=1035111 RepID=UPI00200C240F|nr:uncharacterized protein LOC125235169 [Leguminivora glycinivorella]